MRRRIRLTGRRQLSRSVVKVSLTALGESPLVVMSVLQPDAFKNFPADARVSLRLVENKRVEVVDFGTIGKLHPTQKLTSGGMTAPSCQLRIADPGHKAKGLLLASTENWTLRGDDDRDNENSKGILQFLAADTAPQSWKLDINESDYPVVRVDKRIPNAGLWARTDPIFMGTALPAIVREVFDEILREEYSRDTPWVEHWMQWADTIMPGEAPPEGVDTDRAARALYLDRLLDSFCGKHDLADKLVAVAARPEEV